MRVDRPWISALLRLGVIGALWTASGCGRDRQADGVDTPMRQPVVAPSPPLAARQLVLDQNRAALAELSASGGAHGARFYTRELDAMIGLALGDSNARVEVACPNLRPAERSGSIDEFQQRRFEAEGVRRESACRDSSTREAQTKAQTLMRSRIEVDVYDFDGGYFPLLSDTQLVDGYLVASRLVARDGSSEWFATRNDTSALSFFGDVLFFSQQRKRLLVRLGVAEVDGSEVRRLLLANVLTLEILVEPEGIGETPLVQTDPAGRYAVGSVKGLNARAIGFRVVAGAATLIPWTPLGPDGALPALPRVSIDDLRHALRGNTARSRR